MNSRSYTGQFIDLVNPDLSKLQLEDFSVPLSRICRFTGATTEFYSVAAHSVFVAELCSFDENVAKLALIHDAHEAIIGDISRPVKQVLGKNLEKFEKKIQNAMFKRFGILDSIETTIAMQVVKHFDTLALQIEGKRLMVAKDWIKPPMLIDIDMMQIVNGPHGLQTDWKQVWEDAIIKYFGRELFK